MDVSRVLAVVPHPQNNVFRVEAAWGFFRTAHRGFGKGGRNSRSDIEPGLWPGMDDPDVFEEAVGVHNRRDAHFELTAKLPDAGDAVSRAENAVGYEGADLAGDLLLEGGAVLRAVFVDVAHISTVHRIFEIQAWLWAFTRMTVCRF